MTFSVVAVAALWISDAVDRMSKQIKLKIFPDGQVQAEVLGFRGKKCTDYISVLEQLLDAETIDSERTQEYYLDENEFVRVPQAQSVGQG